MQASGWCCMRSTFLQILLTLHVAPPDKCYYNVLLCCDDYFSLSSVVLCAFSVLCVYSKFGHHHQSPGLPCAKFFVSFAATIAELAHGENRALTHPAYLMHRKLKLALQNIFGCPKNKTTSENTFL